MSPSGAGWALENMSNPAEKAQDSLAALKQLLGAIQPNDLTPGNDMTRGLDRLRQLFAKAPVADTSVDRASDPKDGLNLNQLPGSENAARINGAPAGERAGGRSAASRKSPRQTG